MRTAGRDDGAPPPLPSDEELRLLLNLRLILDMGPRDILAGAGILWIERVESALYENTAKGGLYGNS